MPKTFLQLCEDLGYIGLSFPTVAPIPGVPSVDDVDNAAFDLTNPVNLQKLNAYVGDLGNTPTMNPYYPINALWRRLLSAGIVFDLNAVSITGESGVQAIPITQWGGAEGMTLNGTYQKDDGTRVPGGLSIVFRWYTFSGKYTVTAEFKPTPTALATESAPANNMGGGGIAGKDVPLGRKKKKVKVLKRNPPATV